MYLDQAPTNANFYPDAEALQPYAETMAAYDQVVAPIQAQLAAGTPAEKVGGYLGSGANKHAFRATTAEGQVVVVKTLQPEPHRLVTVGEDAAAYLAGRITAESAPLIANQNADPDDDAFEQLLAVNPQEGVMVTSLKPGKRVYDASLWDLLSIKPRHLERLGRSLDIMRDRGLHPHNAGGILFDPQSGFNFVDYHFDSDPLNKGSIETVQDFLDYATADLKAIDEMHEARQLGAPVNMDSYRAGPLRGITQAIVARRAKNLAVS